MPRRKKVWVNEVEGEDIRIDYPSGEMLPYQREFHTSKAKYRAIIGGYGCGKTTTGVMEAIIQSLLYPNNLGLIGRADAVRLRLTTMEVLNELLPSRLVVERNEHLRMITLINGSRIIYTGLLEAYDSIEKIKSLNLGWFYIDQAEEIDENVFIELKNRLRRTPSGRCAWITANPRGKNWIYKYFVSKEALSPKDNPEDWQYWKVSSYENKYLPQDYIEELEKLPEHLYKVYVLGEFEGFKDNVFNVNWDDVIVNYQDFEDTVKNIGWGDKAFFIAGIDYGFRNPTAILFIVLNHSGIWVFDEIYRSEMTIEDMVQAIKEKEELWGVKFIYVIDPATKQRSALGGTSILDELSLYFQVIPGNNEIKISIARIQSLFNQGKIKITNNCKNLIKELKEYSWKEEADEWQGKTQEKISTSKADHAVDALRYAINYLYDSGIVVKTKSEIQIPNFEINDDYDKFLRIYSKYSKRFITNFENYPWMR